MNIELVVVYFTLESIPLQEIMMTDIQYGELKMVKIATHYMTVCR